MTVHVFGIRHHGPGSARSLVGALETLHPDAILVEGPPDAAGVLPLLAHAAMQPPVALLIYRPDQPRQAVYYPFARFSPEWQAIHYGLTHDIPVRFMDLPQAHQLGEEQASTGEGESESDGAGEPGSQEDGERDNETHLQSPVPDLPSVLSPQSSALRRDPLGWLAEAAGESDGERWWERMVEQRRDSTDLFTGIHEAMTAMRAATPPLDEPREVAREARREAYMRQTIRAAQREGFTRIAVVCGAWHAPVLAEMPPAKEDADLLKGLPKVKVEATWVPWTDERLAYTSGYGAGIESPGWYGHLWRTHENVATRWLTRVARLLRDEDLDASSAHVIEAVRLAETLAALRERAQPGLPELNEATLAVLCHGDDTPMRLIHRRLIVGDQLGAVPDETPMVPLQQDLTRQQRRLRLPAEATQRTLDLDLRQPTDLQRSHLLHRLTLLEVPWGEHQRTTGKSGTFHEFWQVQWRPELAVALIEAGVWGNTIAEAAAACARGRADRATALATLTGLVDRALLADLPDAVIHLMTRLRDMMALTSDVPHLMEALPPLVNVLRYGNVRQTDSSMVGQVVDGLVARICIGLPVACASLDDEAAAAMFTHIVAVHSALALLNQSDHLATWHDAVRRLADRQTLHGLVAGRCCRLLLDAGVLDANEVARRLGLALSTASEPAQAAAWVEGLLKGSGLLLLHDDTLWTVLDEWITALPGDTFVTLLPLLRRTFATFAAPERRQMGERVRSGPARSASGGPAPGDFDVARGDAVLPLVAQLLGLPPLS